MSPSDSCRISCAAAAFSSHFVRVSVAFAAPLVATVVSSISLALRSRYGASAASCLRRCAAAIPESCGSRIGSWIYSRLGVIHGACALANATKESRTPSMALLRIRSASPEVNCRFPVEASLAPSVQAGSQPQNGLQSSNCNVRSSCSLAASFSSLSDLISSMSLTI